MGSNTTTKPWADGPFKLVETPQFQEMKAGEVDPYIRSASVMAVYHNVILRGLNSIYLQAPHVTPADYKDFIGYCDCWYQLIDSHHRGEENDLFPQIEEKVGEKGLLDINVEQHHSFEPGLQAFHAYLASVTPDPTTFDGKHLCTLVDAIAPALETHLQDEIPSLLALHKYGSKLPILTLTAEESHRSSKRLAKTGPTMFFFTNLDLTFEEGLWANWPPIPWPVRWALVRGFGSWNSGWWRFSSCDYDGRPKELYALGKEDGGDAGGE